MRYLDRMIEERIQLEQKIELLRIFLDDEEFLTLSQTERELLSKQYDTMIDYSTLLSTRIGIEKSKQISVKS